ncbi:hypothetical protein B0H10DRAFT_2083069 [Mycena sp. CBHHK59/15]|nr:hypothetical protein B0H10DRAFT_2083069 [Mycena sp. CBHHK59/15]
MIKSPATAARLITISVLGASASAVILVSYKFMWLGFADDSPAGKLTRLGRQATHSHPWATHTVARRAWNRLATPHLAGAARWPRLRKWRSIVL